MVKDGNILNVSYDPVLLQTRSAILQLAGYRVSAAETFRRALGSLVSTKFDLLVMDALPTPETMRLRAKARERGTQILLLIRENCFPLSPTDMFIRGLDGPGALLRAVESLMRPRVRSAEAGRAPQ